MKKPLLLLVLLGSVSFEGSSQWDVLPGAPVPASRINDVFFLDASTGWIASGAGVIYRTTDAGLSWQLQFQKSGTHFRSIGFADNLNGWAGCLGIGDPNNPSSTDTTILYRTVNGGATWVRDPGVSGAVPRGFCGMQVVNDTVVYGVGRVRGPATLYRSFDGGGTWLTKDMSEHAAGLIDVRFFGPDTGFAVGLTHSDHTQSGGVVLRTTDRGETWTAVHTTLRTGEWCWKISFPSRSVGYVSLQRNSQSPVYVLKTTDGGSTWSEKLFSQSNYFVQGIGFVTDSLGWIGGNSSLSPYVTTDGGESWSATTIGRRVNRFRFIDKTIGYAAGETVYAYRPEQTTVALIADVRHHRAGSIGYPNPFNPSTTIRFTVPPELTTTPVTLIIYDALGREVARLIDDELEGGTYERSWSPADQSSGTYYYRLTMGGKSDAQKLVLIR